MQKVKGLFITLVYLALVCIQPVPAPVPRCSPLIIINKLAESSNVLSDSNPYFPVPPCEYGGWVEALQEGDLRAVLVTAEPHKIPLHNFYEFIWLLKTGGPRMLRILTGQEEYIFDRNILREGYQHHTPYVRTKQLGQYTHRNPIIIDDKNTKGVGSEAEKAKAKEKAKAMDTVILQEVMVLHNTIPAMVPLNTTLAMGLLLQVQGTAHQNIIRNMAPHPLGQDMVPRPLDQDMGPPQLDQGMVRPRLGQDMVLPQLDQDMVRLQLDQDMVRLQLDQGMVPHRLAVDMMLQTFLQATQLPHLVTMVRA